MTDWIIYGGAVAILIACGYYAAGILIEHPGRHEKPRDAAPLDAEDEATVTFLHDLHEPEPHAPAVDDTIIDLRPPEWVREHLDGCETVGAYFDKQAARARRS